MTRFGAAAAVCALALSVCFSTNTSAQQFDQQSPPAMQPLDAPEATEAPQSVVRRSAPRYFIDFRSRSALSYGHSFVVFGRVGERLTPRNVAGLHPRGDSSVVYMIGHILPVPSDTGASDGDLDEQYMTARYRIYLTPAEYRAVVARIRELQASTPVWNAATYNCNAFTGTVAHFVGLVAPPTWLLPEDFINSMRQMNDNRQHASLPWSAEATTAMARHVSPRRKTGVH